jgi:hypothetical protein
MHHSWCAIVERRLSFALPDSRVRMAILFMVVPLAGQGATISLGVSCMQELNTRLATEAAFPERGREREENGSAGRDGERSQEGRKGP